MSEYYMFNKPGGCITARRDPRHKTVMDYFPEEKRDTLFPVGRLDKDTEGLLLVTDDGVFNYNLLTPEREVPKTYFFWVKGRPSEEEISDIESGVKIYKNHDFETSPSKIEISAESTIGEIKELLSGEALKLSRRKPTLPVTSGYITITEGKKHQVKRMLMSAGCKVIYLKRTRIGDLSLDEGLPKGAYRPLTEEELRLLGVSEI